MQELVWAAEAPAPTAAGGSRSSCQICSGEHVETAALPKREGIAVVLGEAKDMARARFQVGESTLWDQSFCFCAPASDFFASESFKMLLTKGNSLSLSVTELYN